MSYRDMSVVDLMTTYLTMQQGLEVALRTWEDASPEEKNAADFDGKVQRICSELAELLANLAARGKYLQRKADQGELPF